MPPIHVLIKPASSLCNMRCAYCFYADVAEHRGQKSYGVMSEETLEALTARTFADATGSAGFMFQGGEPTLAGLAFFEKAVALQRRYNARRIPVLNTIQTNGLLLDADWARFLRENNFLVGLSMDGDAATHNENRRDAAGAGTWSRVTRAADLLARHGCEFNILCVVTRAAAEHGQRVYNALKRYRYLQFIPCIDGFGADGSGLSLTADAYGRFLCATFDAYYADFMRGQYVSVRAFDNYVQMLRGRPPESCAMRGVCGGNLVVEGDGSAYPCDFYVLDEWRLGNVRETQLSELMGSERAKAFVDGSRAQDPGCAGCQWALLCRGGCRRDRQPDAVSPLGRNRFCASFRTFFAYAAERLAEMARRCE